MIVLLCLLVLPGEALADLVKCPVCGQVFGREVKTCPNDGTNLELLGKPIESEKPAAQTKAEETSPPTDDAASSKYKRHDQNGERRATPRPRVDTYSDRHARLVGDRRGGPTEEEREDLGEKARAEYEAKDRSAAEQFRRQREQAWGLRRQEQEDASALRRELLARRDELLASLAAPLTSLGTRLWWMQEGQKPGAVLSGELDVNLVRNVFRLGLSTSLGIRFLENRGDILFLETLVFGVQLPWRFSPFVVGRAGLGGLSTELGQESMVNPLGMFGAEVGLDVWTNPWLCLTPNLGYSFLLDGEDMWHSFTAKLSVGF
ncbi:MAG: hypothetical protein MUC50_09540 [Myxococcota bacterium]|jgi:hypothetical protein|nr:hypothetical protein [Myxococcota bacterium]